MIYLRVNYIAMSTQLTAINLFPIKSLNGLALDQATLISNIGLTDDRRWGLLRPSSPDLEQGLKEEIASYELCYSLKDGNQLTTVHIDNYSAPNCEIELSKDDNEKLTAKLDTEQGRLDAQQFISLVSNQVAKLVDSQNHPLWDRPNVPITIINLESVKDLSEKVGTELDYARFRGNLMISGLPAWEEMNWEAGQKIKIGKAMLQVMCPIKRCVATNINPKTGEVDIKINHHLVKHYRHTILGVGCNVITDGEICLNDELIPN